MWQLIDLHNIYKIKKTQELRKGVRSQSQVFSTKTVLYEAFFILEEKMDCAYFWVPFSYVSNLFCFLSFSCQLFLKKVLLRPLAFQVMLAHFNCLPKDFICPFTPITYLKLLLISHYFMILVVHMLGGHPEQL